MDFMFAGTQVIGLTGASNWNTLLRDKSEKLDKILKLYSYFSVMVNLQKTPIIKMSFLVKKTDS